MKKLILTALLLFCGLSSIVAKTESISSPDKKLMVTIHNEGGKIFYNVNYSGKPFVENSPLGLKTDIGDFTDKLLLSDKVERREVSDSYSIPNIKATNVEYQANQAVFTFEQNGKSVISLTFNVSNNNIAFKYGIIQHGDTRCATIFKEITGFAFPKGTTTFLSSQSDPQVGWMRTKPSYEEPYVADDEMGKNGSYDQGYTFPCLFRNNDNGWVLISETGVSSNYCASRLMGGKGARYTVGYPMEKSYNGHGTVAPGISLPGETPWRTITLGETLKPIAETTIAYDVVKPLYEPTKKYTYGLGSWSWIIGQDNSINYDEQKRYIDFTSEMGWSSVLIDNWWDNNIGRDGIEKLAKYAQNKNVELFLWYNSNGYWNDAPQTPRNIMNNSIARRKEMKWMQSIGIKGIKVDFFGSDKQMTMQLYEDILSEANEYGLLVIFHGCTLPRGWERMYPNFVANEAVLASENLNFTQDANDKEAFNACLHPFIRNAVASMDFGGSTLNKYYNVTNEKGKGGGTRVTSDVFELATAVLFQSAMQHTAMAPNNLTDAPKWAVDFMKEVPSTWDEVKYIDGYPGKYVVLARRHADKWYVVGINAQKNDVKIDVELPMFLSGDELCVYADDSNLKGSLEHVKLKKSRIIKATIPCNGGLVITK
ncbi:MAG: glycoside hydrolase family 97 catalytic domain-containing protein [Mangrovibacterium sp.]